MANPVLPSCIAGQWVLVAENVVSGLIWKVKKDPDSYLHTYRETGDDAPTTITEGMPIFRSDIVEEISSSIAIDVYVWCVGADGQVRVDL